MDYEDQRSEYSEDFEDDAAQDNESAVTWRDQTKVQSYTHQRRNTERSGDRGSKAKKAVTKRTSSISKLSPYKCTSSLLGSSPKDRVISARVHEISALQNELAEKKAELNGLRKENKLLLRLQARQEKELNKLQHQEGELPQILASHAQEVRALREHLRRTQEVAHVAEKKLTEVREELLKTSGRVKELEDAARKKDLMERVALTLQVQQANDGISAKDKKIAELQRNSEVLAKNHAQEMRALIAKNRTLTQETEELKDMVTKTQHRLKEKEKELDVLNIYSQRINCSMPRGLSTNFHTPLMDSASTQTEFSFPPVGSVSLRAAVHSKAAAMQTEVAPSSFEPLTTWSLPPESMQNSPTTALNGVSVDSAPHVASCTDGFQKESKQVTPLIETFTRMVNTLDGSHVEDASLKPAVEKNVVTSNATNGNNLPEEEEDRQKKEILLAKLRALSTGPPASVPLNMSTLARNTAEPVTGSTSVHLGTKASDSQVLPPTLHADTRGAVPSMLHADTRGAVPSTLHADTRGAVPAALLTDAKVDLPAPRTTMEPRKEHSNETSEPSIDSRQLLLAKLMAGGEKMVTTGQTGEAPSEGKGGSKPAKPHPGGEANADPVVSKQLLLAKLMAIDAGKEAEPAKKSGTSGVPDLLGSEKPPTGTQSDSPSSHSTPNKLENLHRGKPAFATDDDPFGFRIISAEKKKQKDSKQSAFGGTFVTETESELPSQTKPKFGRRVQAPPQGGNPVISAAEPSLLSSIAAPVLQQSYQPSFRSTLLQEVPVASERNTAGAIGGSQSHALGSPQLGAHPLEDGAGSRQDAWQRKGSMHGAVMGGGGLSKSDGNQRPAKPLLPLRPKATENNFDIMPGAIQGDDDLEEITL